MVSDIADKVTFEQKLEGNKGYLKEEQFRQRESTKVAGKFYVMFEAWWYSWS